MADRRRTRVLDTTVEPDATLVALVEAMARNEARWWLGHLDGLDVFFALAHGADRVESLIEQVGR